LRVLAMADRLSTDRSRQVPLDTSALFW
jgi:hypothetical protein